MIRNFHNHKLQTNPWHRVEEPHNNCKTQSKATSFLYPVKMIAKLEWTQSNAQQNIEQLHNPTMDVTINNESTTTEPPSLNGQQPIAKQLEGGGGGLKCILLVPNLCSRYCRC